MPEPIAPAAPVTSTTWPANGGSVVFMTGPAWDTTFYDYSGSFGFTFRFGDEDDDLGHRDHDGISGWGWLVHPDPDSGYVLTSDWLFTAHDICEFIEEGDELPPPPAVVD